MRVYALVCVFVWVVGVCVGERCGGDEEGKSPGDNHYRLVVNGDVERYQPTQRYVVTLVGARTHSMVQSFTGFNLWLEPLDPSEPAGPARVGSFQLFADSLSVFSEQCPRQVTAADDLPKTEVQVMWQAPPPGAGCVLIKAAVVENSTRWFSSDGQLTARVCEDKSATASTCCACDHAHYQMSFSGLWSPASHPKNFPTQALWLTHFSDVIVASHVTNFTFWGEGQIASDGFRSLAEWGSPGLLERELRQRGARGSVRAVARAPGLWHPNLNGNTSAQFTVDRERHLVSAASMFGPSPDWVVGVSGVELCRADCSWEPQLVMELQPYDAGTDSGISYLSPNIETRPRERMTRITPMYPEDPRAPFYDPRPGATIAPLARVTLTRTRLIPAQCGERELQQLVQGDSDHTADKPECAVTPWSAWSPCSVSCGKGLRTRTRQYAHSAAASDAACDRQLVAREMCVANIAECVESPLAAEDDTLLSPADPAGVALDPAGDMCAVSEWGEWSECDDCGGTSVRRRHFINRMAAKKCPLVQQEESRPCPSNSSVCSPDPVDPDCPVSEWGAWSPCSATCGAGAQYRTRLLLVPAAQQRDCAANTTIVEQRMCNEDECVVDMATAKRICMEVPEPGPCRGEFERWAWVSMKGMCVPFPYGGCRGNRNNFKTQQQCNDTCSVLNGVSGPLGGMSVTNDVSNNLTEEHSADCVMSPWSDWSQCSVTCGVGRQQRLRTVLRPAGPGGAPCPTRVSRRRRCSRHC